MPLGMTVCILEGLPGSERQCFFARGVPERGGTRAVIAVAVDVVNGVEPEARKELVGPARRGVAHVNAEQRLPTGLGGPRRIVRTGCAAVPGSASLPAFWSTVKTMRAADSSTVVPEPPRVRTEPVKESRMDARRKNARAAMRGERRRGRHTVTVFL